MTDTLLERVAQRRRRVHDGGDGVRHSVHHVVDLVEVGVAKVLLHKGGDWLGLTVGVEQRSLHHSNSFYTKVQQDYDYKWGRFLLFRDGINCISGTGSVAPSFLVQNKCCGYSDEAEVRSDTKGVTA